MQPVELHQRTYIVIGSPRMVDEMKEFLEKYSTSTPYVAPVNSNSKS